MSPGDWAGVASAGAAWLALVLAGISLYRNHRSDKRQDEFDQTAKRLNELLIAKETQAQITQNRADMSARLINNGRNSYRLKVFNKGPGSARNVRLLDLQEDETVLDSEDIQTKFPRPLLEQHDSIEVLACLVYGGSHGSHIKLSWDDDTGENHEKELWPRF